MMAGVSSIDVALLVVAADDGIMPQTREHFEILNLLDIPLGIVAINKIYLADDSRSVSVYWLFSFWSETTAYAIEHC